MKGYVYLIENKINDKKYVGKTYLPIQERWRQHRADSQRKNKQYRPLYNAMKKYGIENFFISELEYCENCEEREKYWIMHYDSFHNGYNATLGGDGRPYFEYTDEEVLSKFYELKTIKAVAEFFGCDTHTVCSRLKNNNIVVSPCGDIYNAKRNWVTKQIEQYDLQGKKLQEFASLTQAAQWLIENEYSKGQIKHIVSNISKNIRNIENRKQAYGFVWKEKMED